MFFLKYIAILKENSSFSLVRLILLGLAAGVSGTLLLIIINDVIGLDPSNKNFYPKLFIGYVAVLGIHHITQLVYQTSLIRLTQKLIWTIRLQVLNNVRQADLMKYLSFGSGRVFNILTTDAGAISFIGNLIASVTVLSVTIVTCLIYLAYMSVSGFLVTALVMIVIAAIYMIAQNRVVRQIAVARKEEDSFFEYLDNVISGIKELKLDRRKSESVFGQAKIRADRAQEMVTRSSINSMNNTLLGGFFFFFVICIFLFILPYFKVSLLGNTSQYILITIYILRPAQEIAHTLPFIYQANISIDRVKDLSELRAIKADEPEMPAGTFGNPRQLILNNVSFSFRNEGTDKFGIAPVNMEIQAGQIVFITGGNGSGKSTLINLLCGLYVPASGSMAVDGIEITHRNVTAYRSLFAAVFTDSYLFRRHFGVEPCQDAEMNDLLDRLGLAAKVGFENSTFSTIQLSYGQKKRLSLASALIENKSIYIFDEVCANQDAKFKIYFYNTVLPELRERGKMVIVVTHDERFGHVADKHYHMEAGVISELIYSSNV